MYRGVKYSDPLRCWTASIRVNKQYHYLGEFGTAEEAARAYDQKATELLGQYATLNFPKADNGIVEDCVEGWVRTMPVVNCVGNTSGRTETGRPPTNSGFNHDPTAINVCPGLAG